MSLDYHRIVIKLGSNVLTRADNLLNTERMMHLAAQIAAIKNSGREVILVSSGAVASGRGLIQLSERADAVAARQLFAAIGQVGLINTYHQLFGDLGILCAQVLVTKEDFRDRLHYLNMKNCLDILLRHQVIPIINENDVVSVTELMFTDNDELAGLVASMLSADALIILTNVDGIYDGDPRLETSTIIEEIAGAPVDLSSYLLPGRSTFGRGGMITKSAMARKAARLGIPVHIANGTKTDILHDLLEGRAVHTRFVPDKRASAKKKWLAHTEKSATGMVKINAGAKAMLLSATASSLLPVGIVEIVSGFKKGDIIKLIGEDGKPLGLGIAAYGDEKAKALMGQKRQKPLVHYDYLFLL